MNFFYKITKIAAQGLQKTPRKLFFFILGFFAIILTFKVGYWQAMLFLVVICALYLYANEQNYKDKVSSRQYKLDAKALKNQNKYLDYMMQKGRENDDDQ